MDFSTKYETEVATGRIREKQQEEDIQTAMAYLKNKQKKNTSL